MGACPLCGSSDITSYASQLICGGCANVLEESQIVSDVTFGENSAGGAIVQGSYVSNDQTHVRSSDPRFRSSGSGESREQTKYRASQAIDRMGRAHNVSAHVRKKAERWFSLALEGSAVNSTADPSEPKNYVLGRKAEYTVASCLYVACRMEQTKHMLIDFSESLNINVFELGRHYLQLVRALNLQLPVLDPSIYISRFAALLDFGEHTNKVAKDATRLCARFKKDWLVDGRRPAGICGACLLLAARMNNFRRSMNEIVQVVKIADVTIRQRLEEFKRTPSGNLTIDNFLSVWLEEEHEPPAFYRPQIEAEKLKKKQEKQKLKEEKAAKRKNKKMKMDEEEEDDVDADADDEQEGDEAASSSNNNTNTNINEAHPNQLPPELDALVDEATANEVGRFWQREEFQMLDKQAEERNLASAERARRGDVWHSENDVDPIDALAAEAQGSATADAIKTSASQAQQERDAVLHEQDQEAAMSNSSAAAGPSTSRVTSKLKQGSQPPMDGLSTHDNLSDLDEAELDQFILGPEEVKIKERVWMEFNHDYLQYALQRQLKEEADEKAGIKRRPPRRRGGPVKPRDSSTAPSNSALESTRQMMQKKKLSKKINYDALKGLFNGMDGVEEEGGRSGTRKKNKKKGSSKKNQVASSTSTNKKRSRATAESETGDETTDAETRDARGRRWFGNEADLDDGDVIEEEADLPIRKLSKAERELKEKRSKNKTTGSATAGGAGATTDDGEESGFDYGQQFTDGATTDGDFGEDDEGFDGMAAALQNRYANDAQGYFDDEEEYY